MIKSLEGSAAGYLMEHYPEELAMNLALAAVVMPGMSGRELAVAVRRALDERTAPGD